MLQMNTHKATDLCHLRNVVSPLPGTKVRGLKVRVNRTELRLALLERKIQQHELEVAVAIDCCLKKIDERMDAFCAEQKRECILKLDGLLHAKRFSEQVEVDTLLNVHSFAELEEELKQLVQYKLSDLFGIKSVEIAALHPQVIDKPGMLSLASAIVECRRTFFITATMLKVGNKVWQESLDSAQIAKPAQKVLGKIELGTVFFEAIDCIPQKQFRQYRQHLAERLKGIIENCSRRLLIGFRAAVAQIFYQIYDDSFAGQFAQQRMFLLEQLKANNRINLSYPSPCITKQAG
jgi:hypothetical protein